MERIGLHEHERVIYLSLLEVGSGSISDIVKKTDLHRPTVYKWIPELVQKQLVSFSPHGKRKVYYPESPQRLRSLLKHAESELESILPELIETYEHSHNRPTVRYFEGDDVVTAVYEDVLDTCAKGDVFYRYESPKDYKKFDEWLPPQYFERICKKKEIDKFVITNEKTAKTKKRVLERVERAVPQQFDAFEYDITQIIYNEKVAFIDFDSKVAWIIDSPRFANFQRQLFQLLFRNL